MELDDRVTIATPEGIELQLQLAGPASRFIAGATDFVIQNVAVILLALLTGALTGGGALNAAGFVIGEFVITFLYPILFETLAGGRSPGKRATHLRVVRDDGAPIDLPASATRNLMRAIDGPLLAYLPTVISIIASARNQRPGDIAAGTLVIREAPPRSPGRSQTLAAPPVALPEGWDVTAVTPQEIAAVRRFLERRETLERHSRHALAVRLATGLGTKVAGAQLTGDPERFLETLVALKSARG